MTREEHIAALEKYRDGILSGGISVPYDDLMIALDASIAALRGPIPDPDTGLMPCGCGGVPVVVNEPGSWGYYPERWHIRCCEDPWKRERCGMRTSSVETKEEAKRIWNTAMGWRVEG